MTEWKEFMMNGKPLARPNAVSLLRAQKNGGRIDRPSRQNDELWGQTLARSAVRIVDRFDPASMSNLQRVDMSGRDEIDVWICQCGGKSRRFRVHPSLPRIRKAVPWGIIDCFDGMVISWSIGTQPDAGLVNTMLDAAIGTVANGEQRPIIHSDRGAHYRWPGWLNRISNAQLVRSMSRKGCSQDNAAREGFFGRLKTELFYPRDWKAITIEQFVAEVDAYIRWYNEKRIKISLGSLSPIEYRHSLGLNL